MEEEIKLEEGALEIEVTKVEQEESLGELFEFKIPMVETDDYGNEVTKYYKENHSLEMLQTQRDILVKSLAELDEKIAKVNSVK